ncbi:hypothetical protein [Escherichia coli]|uniref:hypothetical protein n=1 Tax=Escherichia coli TaxID=562 RepID=UPI0020325EAA|nr:hypothetical protein [Escherichia coli]
MDYRQDPGIVTDATINFYFDESWVNSGNDIIKRETQTMPDYQHRIMEPLKHINNQWLV